MQVGAIEVAGAIEVVRQLKMWLSARAEILETPNRLASCAAGAVVIVACIIGVQWWSRQQKRERVEHVTAFLKVYGIQPDQLAGECGTPVKDYIWKSRLVRDIHYADNSGQDLAFRFIRPSAGSKNWDGIGVWGGIEGQQGVGYQVDDSEVSKRLNCLASVAVNSDYATLLPDPEQLHLQQQFVATPAVILVPANVIPLMQVQVMEMPRIPTPIQVQPDIRPSADVPRIETQPRIDTEPRMDTHQVDIPTQVDVQPSRAPDARTNVTYVSSSGGRDNTEGYGSGRIGSNSGNGSHSNDSNGSGNKPPNGGVPDSHSADGGRDVPSGSSAVGSGGGDDPLGPPVPVWIPCPNLVPEENEDAFPCNLVDGIEFAQRLAKDMTGTDPLARLSERIRKLTGGNDVIFLKMAEVDRERTIYKIIKLEVQSINIVTEKLRKDTNSLMPFYWDSADEKARKLEAVQHDEKERRDTWSTGVQEARNSVTTVSKDSGDDHHSVVRFEQKVAYPQASSIDAAKVWKNQ